jgi:hypothetical protein
MMRVALLDDFQNVGRTMGPRSRLGDRAEVTAFTATIADEDALAAALEGGDWRAVCDLPATRR